jgi:hypothetical protein
MNERQRRILFPVALAVIGFVLFVPRLSAFGFWDPYEIRIADAARTLVQATWTWGQQLGKPPLPMWLVALGFKSLGVGELGGRLPFALTSLAALMAVYYAGAALIGRRGAFIGALALATTPCFLFGARQLTSDAPMILGAALALGGLARAAWPEPGTSLFVIVLDLLLGIAGLVIGQLTLGVLPGVVAPLAGVTAALAIAGAHLVPTLIGALTTLGFIVQAILEWKGKTAYSAVLGGTPHAIVHTTTLTSHLTKIGFQLFPWVAIAPVAMVDGFSDGLADPTDPQLAESSRPSASPEGAMKADEKRRRFGTLVLIACALTAWLTSTLHSAGLQDLHAPIAPALMLLCGGFLDLVLRQSTPQPIAGMAIALMAVVLGRDLFSQPELYVGTHMIDTVRWPGPLTHVPYIVMAYGAFFAGVIGLALGAPLGASEERSKRGRLILVGAGAGAAVIMALVSAHVIIPQVSKHLSARDLYGKTKTLDPNAPVGQYRFNASGASYYAGNQTPTTLSTINDLFTFLGRSERVFVMAGSEELPPIDQESRQKKAAYYVIDDSNSRFLVLSNRLGPNEQDLNPLKRFISDQPPKPQFPVEADFEGKVQLLGYDLPGTLSRGQDFKVRLYFKVNKPVGGAYKVFIHFDGPGNRFNGDHVPLEGRFPTHYWVPGYYITDEHLIVPDRGTQPAGYYRVFMGLFAGEGRLKVVNGPQDGDNRVKLGGVTIK